MPDCPHCHKYYFGNPDQCPNCYYEFKTGRIRTPDTVLKERQRQQEERAKQIEYERRQVELKREERSVALRNNAQYEYATEFLGDSRNGMLDKSLLDSVLRNYAEAGWRLHSVFTNEAGKNASSVSIGGMTAGTNATVDVTILIFERCIKLQGRE